MNALLLAPLLVPLGTALLAALSASRPRLQGWISLGGVALFFACASALFQQVMREGTLRAAMGNWEAPFGIEIVADPLGAGMVLVTALIAASALTFQLSSADPAPASPGLLPLLHGLFAAVSGAFLTGDIFNLYVWFELMLVCSLGLIAHRAATRQLDATLKYFVLNALGTLFLLLGIAFLYGATGHLGFGALAAAAQATDPARLAPFVTLIALAFLVKAGAFPVYGWLPASYPSLPAPILALFAGLLTKVGVYALLRLFATVFPVAPSYILEALMWIAAATMVVGVLGAAYHWDMRRILAFHIISQIGYMLLGIALASPAAHVATIFYVVHHIVVKANLFLIAALVFRHTGSYDLRKTGGLYAAHPGLAVLFAIPALSLVGIPPLSGFWAKLLMVQETLVQGRFGLAAIALSVGMLTLYSMTKIWFGAFWRRHPDPSWECPRPATVRPAFVATGALAVVTLLIGLAPEQLIVFASAAEGALLGGAP